MRRPTPLLLLVALAGCAVDRPAPLPSPSPPLAILTAFGPRHAGIDIRAAVGTPVLAAANGEVRLVGERPQAGRMMVLAHADELATVYMHLSEVAVRVGQLVRRGEAIGRAGMTGNATTPHLHFGVCRRLGGRCGAGTRAGWDDPSVYWIEGNACFEAGRPYPVVPLRFTFPLPCGGSAQALSV